MKTLNDLTMPKLQGVSGQFSLSHTRASSAQADLLCPGRHLAQRDMPDKPSGPDAARGTRIHDALDTGKTDGLSLDEIDIVDSCRQIEAKLIVQFFGGDAGQVKAIRKQRFFATFNEEDRKWTHTGEPDLVLWMPGRALIIDRKTLAGDVADSPRNQQLRDYLVLVRGRMAASGVILKEIGTAIVQPLVTHSPEICLYTEADMDRAAAELFQRTKASNDPKSVRKAGKVQCEYCLAKLNCVEYAMWNANQLPVVLETSLQESVFKTAIDQWTPNQRAIAASAIGPAEKFLAEIKEYLKAGLEKDPAWIPGWELTPGNKVETITDPQEAFNRFAKLGGQLDAFMGTVKVGKTKLKEALAATTGAKGQALEKALKAVTDGIVVVKQNAPSLRRQNEK